MTTTPTIRFHGTPAVLHVLRGKIKEVVGKEAGGVQEDREEQTHYIEVKLTPDERKQMEPHHAGIALSVIRRPK